MSEQPDYRPNVKLALSGIATKWNAGGVPLAHLLSWSDADLVIDALAACGWSIIPTEVAERAREVVTTHTELEGVLIETGPRFVAFDQRWINPEYVTDFWPTYEHGRLMTEIALVNGRLACVGASPGEVAAKLIGEATPDPFSDSTPLVCSTDPGEACEACT